jgi:hypothetical protein
MRSIKENFVLLFSSALTRSDFEMAISMMDQISMSPHWTIVFATVDHKQMAIVIAVAEECGLSTEVFCWSKSNQLGQSHAGGARQATCVEFVVTVMKIGTGGQADNYALLRALKAESTVSINF